VACLLYDVVLLAFNILPIYRWMGQILRSLLWYGLGAGRSLMVATVLGFVGSWDSSAGAWSGVCGWERSRSFLLLNCWAGPAARAGAAEGGEARGGWGTRPQLRDCSAAGRL